MANLIRANMELMGLRDIRSAIRVDAPTVSTDCKQFAKDNEFGYYVLCNTWLLVVNDYSKYGWMHLAESIRQKGLIPVIKQAQDCADELINSGDISDTIFRSIWKDVIRVSQDPRTPNNDKEIGRHPLATMLMILRYPKRLSPVNNDIIQANSLKKFLEVENRTKLLQRRGYSQYILDLAKDVASEYLNWSGLTREIKVSLANHDCEFTSGVGFDSRANLGSKLDAISYSFPEFFREPFGIPYTGCFANREEEEWGAIQKDTVREVKVAAVPKSYKASRIIAMEDTARQAVSRAVGTIIDRYLPASTPIHDQGVNQKLAWYGSLTGEVSTLDLSNASDCISKTLFIELFPKEFVDLILPLLGTHTVVNGRRYLMQQMSTAGHSLTFILESMVFDIVDRTAVRLLKNWGVDVPTSCRIDGVDYTIPSVYGDDQVVATEAADTTIEVLKALGFIINETKSYTSGKYRESCGAEYYDGVDVSSYYFPRFPLLGTITSESIQLNARFFRDSYRDVYIDTMTSLISLQHRLYGVSYGASRFILELVKLSFPKMTTSFQGSTNADLWDYDTTYSTRRAPCARLEYSDAKYLSDRKPHFVRFKLEGDLSSGDITMSADEVTERRYKYSPVTKYALEKDVSERNMRLFNAYRYRQFLQYGPKFSDPLLKLLGISDAPITLEQAYGRLTLTWGLHETDEK